MWKKLALVSTTLLLGVVLVFGYFFLNGVYSKSTDNRRLIPLSAVEKDLVLGEMRTMLKALHGILDAMAKKDMPLAAEAAASAGMAMSVDADPMMMAKLPLDFKKLGMGTHTEFDELSVQIKAGATQEMILQRLSAVTQRCVACHEVNRLSLIELAPFEIDLKYDSRWLAKKSF